MFLFIITAHLIVGVIGERKFTHETALDTEDKYHMWWKFNDTDITIKVRVDTTGWIGWGLSQNGKMKGADMVIAWVDNIGENHFADRYALGHAQPSIDEHQDYELLEMSEADGCTTFTFTRKLELSDEQDITITQDTMRILYSWNDEDPINDNDIPKHTQKGARSQYLLDYRKKPTLPKQYNTTDVRMNNLALPPDHTTHWCKIFKLPDMGVKKQHLFQVEVIITPGNEGIVRHMKLYECIFIHENDINVNANCLTLNMCTDITIHGWVTGGSSLYYPANAGLSLNTPGDPKFLLLSIHYDNPKGRSDIVDSSGFRLYYTEELRKYDASILTTGIMSNQYTQIIPQQQERFTSYGFCNSKCLNIGDQRHFVYGAVLHAHVHATKMAVRLVNDTDGKEVKTIVEDLNYDPNFQEYRYLKEPIEILPGHRIDVDCTYDTTDMQKPLLSGLGTRKEMCVAYLGVVPALNVHTCISSSDNKYLWGAKNLGWNVTDGWIRSPVFVGETSYNQESAIHPLLDKELWKNNDTRVRSFEQSGLEERYFSRCTFRNGTIYTSTFQNLPRCLIKDIPCSRDAERSTEAQNAQLNGKKNVENTSKIRLLCKSFIRLLTLVIANLKDVVERRL